MNADTLIDEIDAGTLRLRCHSVVRTLFNEMVIHDEDQRALIAAFDAGERLDVEEWAARIWRKIEALPLERQGSLRMSVSLFHPDEELDWESAGYLILWAREQGLPDAKIIEVFHSS